MTKTILIYEKVILTTFSNTYVLYIYDIFMLFVNLFRTPEWVKTKMYAWSFDKKNN